VTIGVNLRTVLAGTILAVALATALVTVPGGAKAKKGVAPADGVLVCNTANGKGKGSLDVDGLDQQGYVHQGSGLSAKSGGNYNAAQHSRALALCSEPVDENVDGSSDTEGPGDGGPVLGGGNG
jgi:hypothetical protein